MKNNYYKQQAVSAEAKVLFEKSVKNCFSGDICYEN